jgi:uncharacterized membrane protein HdeD (DUF308 family)
VTTGIPNSELCRARCGGASCPQQLAVQKKVGNFMIALGIILLIVGFIAKVAILWTIGIVLVLVGLVLMVLGSMGRAVGGRRHYY